LIVPFQFQCPRGHLLEADQSQIGTRLRCPKCKILLLVPPMVAAPPVSGPPTKSAEPTLSDDEPTIEMGALKKDSEPLPQIQIDVMSKPRPKPADPEAVRSLAEPELWHIPCPKGHLLETPREMLGQEAECPFCHARFRLRREKSVEHQRRKAEDEAIRESRLGTAWLRRAIVAAVLVVLALVGLAMLVHSR
jgi:hypothetical protein